MAATDPEAQALGYQLPTGASLIRDGDDAISNNARVAAGHHITLKNRVDALQVDDTTDVDSVNGKTGTVTLTAADVSALPDTYIPTWDEVSGKPTNFPPTGHAGSHAAGGSDAITPESIGAAAIDDPRLLDTGWRSLASALSSNWRLTSQRGECDVRRIGSTVWWRIRITSTANNPALATILTIPQGFRPGMGPGIPYSVLAPPALAITVSDHISTFSMYIDDQAGISATSIVRQSTPAEYTWVWRGSCLTEDPWPTTLPGTPV